MPLISFVVPVYNYGRYLPECLGAIAAQKGDFSYEVIVVDDGSTDDSLSVIEGFADNRYRILVNETNRGHAYTIERGLNAASGDFIARVDPDDRHRPDFLLKTVPVLESHPEVVLVYGDAAMIDESGEETAPSVDDVHDGDFLGNELVPLLERNFICSPTVLARRQGWLSALPVPYGLAFHDWYFTVMMARRHPFYFLDEVLADYRVHPENHHSKIVLDGSEERSVFRLLDKVFDDKEIDQSLESVKRRSKNRIYGAQYLTLARKYFAAGMVADARRCYLKAIRHNPRAAGRPDVLRQLAGTIMGMRIYDRLKSAARSKPSNIEGRRPR